MCGYEGKKVMHRNRLADLSVLRVYSTVCVACVGSDSPAVVNLSGLDSLFLRLPWRDSGSWINWR